MQRASRTVMHNICASDNRFLETQRFQRSSSFEVGVYIKTISYEYSLHVHTVDIIRQEHSDTCNGYNPRRYIDSSLNSLGHIRTRAIR